MSAIKSVLFYLILISTVVGLLLITGCGGNAQKDQMAAFLQDYQKNLSSYAEAITKSDNQKMAELKATLDASKSQWLVLKSEAIETMTPQAVEKFEREFQIAEEQYTSLNKKS